MYLFDSAVAQHAVVLDQAPIPKRVVADGASRVHGTVPDRAGVAVVESDVVATPVDHAAAARAAVDLAATARRAIEAWRPDALVVLARVLDKDSADDVVLTQDLARLDLDVRRLTARATQRLVHVDRRVRHAVALARGACAQQHRAHARRHAHRVRRDVGPDELHGVIDRQAGCDLPAR